MKFVRENRTVELGQCREIIRRALALARCTPGKIDRVVPVGGTTLVPAVRLLIQDVLERQVTQVVNPFEAVALGAAIQAGILDGQVRDSLLVDVNSRALGIEVEGGKFFRIVDSNCPIPVSRTHEFTNAADGDRELSIRVFQGESEHVKENQHLGELMLSGLTPQPKGTAKIQVSFDVDACGTLDVSATSQPGGAPRKMLIEQSWRMKASDVQLARERIDHKRRLHNLRASGEQIAAHIDSLRERLVSCAPSIERIIDEIRDETLDIASVSRWDELQLLCNDLNSALGALKVWELLPPVQLAKEAAGDSSVHPWRGVRLSKEDVLQWSLAVLREDINRVRIGLTSAIGRFTEPIDILEVSMPNTMREASKLDDVASLFVSMPNMDLAACAGALWSHQREAISELMDCVRDCAKRRASLSSEVSTDIWKVDDESWDEVLGTYHYPTIIGRALGKSPEGLAKFILCKQPLSVSKQLRIKAEIREAKEALLAVKKRWHLGPPAFGQVWREDMSNLSELNAIAEWMDCYHSMRLAPLESISRHHDVRSLGRDLALACNSLQDACRQFEALCTKLGVAFSEAFEEQHIDQVQIPIILARLAEWEGNLERLLPWCEYQDLCRSIDWQPLCGEGVRSAVDRSCQAISELTRVAPWNAMWETARYIERHSKVRSK